MHALVTGTNGHLGLNWVCALLQSRHRVRAGVRSPRLISSELAAQMKGRVSNCSNQRIKQALGLEPPNQSDAKPRRHRCDIASEWQIPARCPQGGSLRREREIALPPAM